MNAQFIAAQTDYRLRLTTSFLYSNNVGNFNANKSNQLLLGQVNNGIGANINLSEVIYKGWGMGFQTGAFSSVFNSNNIRQQLITRYQANNDYDTTTGPHTIQFYNIGFDFFKEFNLKNLSISPFVRLALVGVNNLHEFDTKIKKKDDNYFSAYAIKINTGNLTDFYPSLGFSATYHLDESCYLNLGGQYSTGNYRTSFTETKTDLFRDSSKNIYDINQHISTLQFFIGLQLRFGKRKK